MKITKLFKDFSEGEKSGGITLIACTIISTFLANTAFGGEYTHFWHADLGGQSIEYWINNQRQYDYAKWMKSVNVYIRPKLR